MTGKNQGKQYHLLIVVLLILFHITGNYVVLRLDNLFLTGGPAAIALIASTTYRQLQEIESPWDKVRLMYTSTPREYPPLVQTTAMVSMMIFGFKQDVAVMSNSVFVALLFLSTYYLGRSLFDKDIGLMATIILSFFPATYSFSRTLLVDFGLMGVVAFSILMFHKSEKLLSVNWSCFFGVSMGLAALTKPSFSLFLIGPFIAWTVIPLVQSIRKSDWIRVAKVMRNGFLALLVATIIAFPWYYKRSTTYLVLHAADVSQSIFAGSSWHTLSTLRPISPIWLGRTYMTSLGALLFFSSLVYFLWKGKERLAVLSWLAIPYMAMLLLSGPNPLQFGIENDFVRYLLPSLPAAALVVSFALKRLVFLLKGWAPLFRKTHLVLSMILLIEVMGYSAIHVWGNGYLPEPFGPELQGYEKFHLTEQFGFTAPLALPFDTEVTVKQLADRFSHLSSPISLFFLRPKGGITEGLLRQMAMTRNFNDVTEVSCEELWFSSSILYGIRGTTGTIDNCTALFDQADIVFIESIYYDEGTWPWKNSLVYTEEVVPVFNYIESRLHKYELMSVLPLGNPRPEYWRELHPRFDSLNESLWIYVKK